MKPTLVLDSIDTYKESSIEHLKWKIRNFFEDHSAVEVSHMLEVIDEMNAYENLCHLKPLSEEHVIILDEDKLAVDDAEKAVLEGKVFWEHHAAGEATRLGLGTKYTLKLSDLPVSKIAELQKKELEKEGKDSSEVTEEKLIEQIGCRPEDTMPISLGVRHMLQIVYDMTRLAEKKGENAGEVLQRQHMLVAVNEKTADQIIQEWNRHRHYGLDPKKIFFIIQKSFEGIEVVKGDAKYTGDVLTKRLHNHGQLKMQMTHDNEIFWYDGEKHFLTAAEFEKMLEGKKDLLTYSIEDINYLTGSIDWHALSLALDLGSQGYGMVMEIVGQNPLKPQKGGAAFFDEKKGRPVMIESNQLKDLKPEQIEHLNKNFNHYPNPVMAYRALKSGKLDMHTCVKKVVDKDGEEKHYVYFCTPQGDINFLVKTAYVMRKLLKPIANWKSPATTPPTVKACYDQDSQEGFKSFAEKIVGSI